MTGTAFLTVNPGDVVEIWARARTGSHSSPSVSPLSISNQRQCFFSLAFPPPYFEHFRYEHLSKEPAELAWNPSLLEVSFAYRFSTAAVQDDGIVLLNFTEDGIEEYPRSRLAEWYSQEPGRPILRFSPLKNWMNDPNGLCRIGDKYHMFYQFHPNGTDWGPMHWGHAVSTDLFDWLHLPVFSYPEQNLGALGATGGAFSGNAFLDRDGLLSFYRTERLPAYDLFKNYNEVQKRVYPDEDLLSVERSEIVQVEGAPGTGHDIRDPKVWFDEQAGLYRMILGSAVDGDPAITLHSSTDGNQWTFTSILYRAPAFFREGGARCAECPDFFEIDGKWVLIISFVGYTEAATGRHNILYALVGEFDDGIFTPASGELQELDFGTDFYAMQSFFDGKEQLAFAWLFNWEVRKPAGSSYSGEMSLPRVLSVEAGRLVMRPHPNYERLRLSRIELTRERVLSPDPTCAVELRVRGADLAGVRIIAVTRGGAEAVIREICGGVEIQVPDDKERSIQYRSVPLQLRDLLIFLDRGVVEVFLNAGEVCGTRRSYLLNDVVEVRLEGKAGVVEAWNLRSAWEGSPN
ncbi:MAG: glycoside hydrolase family 32 protein [Fimbriimonadaceae bacterium]|nr:glycoside hydrolase family 32 protein [Fimbriimonadaceae bacterium]